MRFENRLFRRVIAFIVDLLVLQILSTILINLGLGIKYTIFGIEIIELTYWQNLLLYLVYFVGFALFNKGVTIGKMLLGIKVLQGNYEYLSDSKLIIREVIKSVFMPISFVSFIVAVFSSENKSIHDLLIDSVVVRQFNYVSNPWDTTTNGVQPDNVVAPKGEYYYDDPAEKKYIDPLDDTQEKDDEII